MSSSALATCCAAEVDVLAAQPLAYRNPVAAMFQSTRPKFVQLAPQTVAHLGLEC